MDISTWITCENLNMHILKSVISNFFPKPDLTSVFTVNDLTKDVNIQTKYLRLHSCHIPPSNQATNLRLFAF